MNLNFCYCIILLHRMNIFSYIFQLEFFLYFIWEIYSFWFSRQSLNHKVLSHHDGVDPCPCMKPWRHILIHLQDIWEWHARWGSNHEPSCSLKAQGVHLCIRLWSGDSNEASLNEGILGSYSQRMDMASWERFHVLDFIYTTRHVSWGMQKKKCFNGSTTFSLYVEGLGSPELVPFSLKEMGYPQHSTHLPYLVCRWKYSLFPNRTSPCCTQVYYCPHHYFSISNFPSSFYCLCIESSRLSNLYFRSFPHFLYLPFSHSLFFTLTSYYLSFLCLSLVLLPPSL